MSIDISYNDRLFKIYGMLETQYSKDFYLKDELFDRVCFYLFDMKRHTSKLSACFRSWLQILFSRIKNKSDINSISYNEILNIGNNVFCIGTCHKMFRLLSDMEIIHIESSNGQRTRYRIDIDRLSQMFIESQPQAEKELDEEHDRFSRKYNRKRRYAIGRFICDTVEGARNRFDTLVANTFRNGEAFIYQLLYTFYVKNGHEDFHIRSADVMTVMSGIASIRNFESTEDWDHFIYRKVITDSNTLQRLIDAIKEPTPARKSFRTENYCKKVKESYIDSNCRYYSCLHTINLEDYNRFFENNYL